MRALTLLVFAALCFPHVAFAGGDIAGGKAIFDTTCQNCHSLQVGVNKVGPSLWHVVGRPSATVDGYAYSDAMKALKSEWTPAALNVYLQNPRGDVHGAKMFFKGLPDPQDRANVIAYLESVQ
jgi:cytochrome c